jgi:MFS family permease
MLGGTLVLGFGFILLGFTQSLAMFYGAFVLIACGAGGCTSVVTMTAVANWFEKNVGKAMGLMACGFGASGLIIPVIVWMITAFGWRATLIILAIGMWLIGIPAAIVMREKPEEIDDSPQVEGRQAISAPSQRRKSAGTFRYAKILKEKSFTGIPATFFLETDEKIINDLCHVTFSFTEYRITHNSIDCELDVGQFNIAFDVFFYANCINNGTGFKRGLNNSSCFKI